LYHATRSGFAAAGRVQLHRGLTELLEQRMYGSEQSIECDDDLGAYLLPISHQTTSVTTGVRCGDWDTVLQSASAEGHKTVVRLLLDKRADANAQGRQYGTAL
jgi:hypothetical protein